MIIKALSDANEVRNPDTNCAFLPLWFKTSQLMLNAVLFLATYQWKMYHHISTEIDLGFRDHSDDDIILFRRSCGFPFVQVVMSYIRFEEFKEFKVGKLGVSCNGKGVQ